MNFLALMCSGSLATLLLADATSAFDAPHPQTVEGSIRRLTVRLSEEFAENRLNDYFHHFLPRATIASPEGVVARNLYESTWREFILTGGAVQSVTLGKVTVLVNSLGNAAVATYPLRLTMVRPSGEAVNEDAVETDVWFLQGTSWKVASVHFSRVVGKVQP